ncbi:MAG: insulinase family protein [Candidatus Omnitrophica bacterium]|nr:insulinase family protein [Candidatus Omnitrophota bacterium]
MYEKTQLDNGLTVASHRMPSRVSVSLGVWMKAGSRYEPKDINGISHFLEHLLFKGTAKRSCEEIKQAVEGIGGSLNGFTSEELTCYLARVPGKYLAPALDVLSDMALNACLRTEDIELERKVILEEIRMYKDLPSHFVQDLLDGLLWPDQPLGRNIAGEDETVSGINREQLVTYKQKFYHPKNILVVACGNLRHQALIEKAKNFFATSSRATTNGFVPACEKQQRVQLKIKVKDIEQTHLALGVHSLPRTDPQRFALGLLHIILGANMSSRLFREVRETRGLAYAISTSLKFLQDTGAFMVHAGIDNKRLPEALEIILEQLRLIKKELIAPDELGRAKEYYIGQLILALEDTSNHMLWLGENYISLNEFLEPKEIIRQVQKIEAEELRELAKRILQTSKLNLALIGPIKDKDNNKIKQRLSF